MHPSWKIYIYIYIQKKSEKLSGKTPIMVNFWVVENLNFVLFLNLYSFFNE